jgi:hypothetical protein
MSPSGDKVAIPTNGHRTPLTDPEVDTHLAEATDLGSGAPDIESIRPSRISVAVNTPEVSPGQLAVGVGLVVGLVLLILGIRRPRRD